MQHMSSKGEPIMMEQTLEFYELNRIHDYIDIDSKKDDTTLLSKIKSIIDSMNDSKYPVCKIIVGEKL